VPLAIASVSLALGGHCVGPPLAALGVALVCSLVALCFGRLQAWVGLRLCLVIDDGGTPLLRLVRVASTIPGLSAGALLVATPAIRGGGVFDQSVIVLTRHDEHGSVGYVLNRHIDGQHAAYFPLADAPPLLHALGVAEAPESVQHGVGGPVELDGWTVIHRFDGVPGSSPLVAGVETRLRAGGALSTLRERTQEAAAEWAADRQQRAEAGGAEEDVPVPLLVHALHGHAAWAPGQVCARPKRAGAVLRAPCKALRRSALASSPMGHAHTRHCPQLEGEIKASLWKWAPRIGIDFALHRDSTQLTWERALAAVAAEGAVAQGAAVA
jgi:putative AlgH/UPF0301 family transcriptional regulator